MAAGYLVELPVFQGPLDLLLHLIEKEELDITEIALAQVTDQYLAYLERMPQREPAELCAFVVVAVRLIWIKSQALLPRSPVAEGDGDETGADLVHQLREYRRFKEVAQQLRQWDAEGRRAFGRLAPSPLPIPRPEGLENATLEALTEALQQRLAELSLQERTVPLAVVPQVTLAEKARQIHAVLQDRDEVLFSVLLVEAPSCEEVVVTLWAVLEMFKRHWITFEQEELFGPITVRRRSDTAVDWDERGEWWTELEELD